MGVRAMLAAVLGGLFMFVWLAMAHMSPLGGIGISYLPRELLVTSTLDSGAGGSGGLYIFPAAPEASAQVPSGFMVFSPDNIFSGGMAGRIGLELTKDIVQALVLMILIAWSRVRSLIARVAFATGVGLLAGFTSNLSLTIWYGFPIAYALGAGAIATVGYVVAGAVIAVVLPRPEAFFGNKSTHES